MLGLFCDYRDKQGFILQVQLKKIIKNDNFNKYGVMFGILFEFCNEYLGVE